MLGFGGALTVLAKHRGCAFRLLRPMLARDTVGIPRLVKETGLSRRTIYRIKDDPTAAEAALAAWGL
jgi:putative DNA-invertase from lambdoid prophage Rac